eukprot:gene4446-14596_t
MIELDSWSAFGIATALIVALLATLLLSPPSKDKKFPPGPPGVPVLGNFSDITSPHAQGHTIMWANTYGPVVGLKLLGRPFVSVTDPKIIAPFISRTDASLSKADLYSSFAAMQGPHGHASLFDTRHVSPYWKAVRKTVSPCFATDALRKGYSHTQDVGMQLIQIWESSEKVAAGESVDVCDYIKRTTFDILGRSGFEMDFGTLAAHGKPHEFLDSLHTVLHQVSRETANGIEAILRKLLPFVPRYAAINLAFKNTYKHYDNVMKTLKDRGEPSDEDKSFGAAIMRLKDPETGKPMADELLQTNLSGMMIAGFDTSAHSITWALYDIARHHDVQAKIHKELEENNLLHRKGKPATGSLEFDNLASFPYFNAVLKECMRFHPVAGGTVRQTETETVIGDYVLPPKTVVWIPMLGLMRSSGNWAQPEVFMPERWMSETAEDTSTGPPLANKAAYLPFMDGYRSCVGMNLAYMTTRALLLMLLSRFCFEVDEAKMGTPEEEFSLVLVPSDGMHLRMRPHV